MLKRFTKKDKKTELDRKIEEASKLVTKLKTKLDENSSKELDYEINSLKESMEGTKKDSDGYLNMTKALKILYEAQASIKSKQDEYSQAVKDYDILVARKDKIEERKMIIKKAFIAAGVSVTMELVGLYFENANVITTKLWSHIPWPKVE